MDRREIKINKRWGSVLVHAATCKLPNCGSLSCTKMKYAFKHGMTCTATPGWCRRCRTLGRLLQVHHKECKATNCPVHRRRDLEEHRRRAMEQIKARRRERYRMDISAKRKFEVKQATRNDDADSNSDTSDEIEVLCEKTPEACEAEKIEKAKRDGNFIDLVHSEPAVERSKRQKVDATTIRNFIDLVHSEPAVERSKRQKVDDNQSARGTGCEGSMTRARRRLISRR